MNSEQKNAENKIRAAVASVRNFVGADATIRIENMMSELPHAIRSNHEKSVTELAGEDLVAGRKIAVTAYELGSDEHILRLWVRS